MPTRFRAAALAAAVITLLPLAGASAQVTVLETSPAVVRGSTWYVRDTLTSGRADRAFTFGSTWTPLWGQIGYWSKTCGCADATAGPIRFKDGVWSLRRFRGEPDLTIRFGQAGDIPIVGHWRGSESRNIGVVRRVGDRLQWRLETDRTSDGIADVVFFYGRPGDIPVAGNWTAWDDNLGYDRPGVVRKETTAWRWLLDTSATPDGRADISLSFGDPRAGDRPIVGRWVDQSLTNIGVVRKGRWLLETDEVRIAQTGPRTANRRTTSDGRADIDFTFGATTDIPVVVLEGRG